MARISYLCIEPPNTEAIVDFFGKYGFTVKIKADKDKRGKPQVWVMVTACDDRCTILGEIVEAIPKADERS